MCLVCQSFSEDCLLQSSSVVKASGLSGRRREEATTHALREASTAKVAVMLSSQTSLVSAPELKLVDGQSTTDALVYRSSQPRIQDDEAE